jgi:chemotaxis protein MotB
MKTKRTFIKSLEQFEGKGLTVEKKNGKVYVSMENKLLFQFWKLGSRFQKKAVVGVAKVLGDNPDISVPIEGHTDDDAFTSGPIADNWDLSTKSTAIVAILVRTKNQQTKSYCGRKRRIRHWEAMQLPKESEKS